ncbi:MAG TPA: hypothetical protein DD658_09810 [Deltaproteobacteria bacterium]|nr:hypothetical protein [Deltaproteobacteria bacterium]
MVPDPGMMCALRDVHNRSERSWDMRGRKGVTQGVIAGLLAVSFLLPAGCATRNYRKEESGLIISQGVKAVNEAKAVEASRSAEGELKVAEERMFQARAAFDLEAYNEAARLAREGAVMADYARAKAAAAKARMNAEEVGKNLEMLRQEIERQSQSK